MNKFFQHQHFYPNNTYFRTFFFTLNLIVDSTCFEDGNYAGNNIDTFGNVNDAASCQKLCQELSECKFWTYNTIPNNGQCWRQTELAPTNLGTCATCTRGPKYCQGKRVTYITNMESLPRTNFGWFLIKISTFSWVQKIL